MLEPFQQWQGPATTVGFQVSVDIVVHHANMAANRPPEPVIVLTEVRSDDSRGWQRHVHQVRFLGQAWTEYGWGPERAHARGTRFDASVWVYTKSTIEYRDADGNWCVADITANEPAVEERPR